MNVIIDFSLTLSTSPTTLALHLHFLSQLIHELKEGLDIAAETRASFARNVQAALRNARVAERARGELAHVLHTFDNTVETALQVRRGGEKGCHGTGDKTSSGVEDGCVIYSYHRLKANIITLWFPAIPVVPEQNVGDGASEPSSSVVRVELHQQTGSTGAPRRIPRTTGLRVRTDVHTHTHTYTHTSFILISLAKVLDLMFIYIECVQ